MRHQRAWQVAAVLAGVAAIAAWLPREAPAQAGTHARLDVTYLGPLVLGQALILDNATGDVWVYELFDEEGRKAGDVRRFGRMTHVGQPIQVHPQPR